MVKYRNYTQNTEKKLCVVYWNPSSPVGGTAK